MRLQDALDYHARERGDADFAVQDGRRLSYRQARGATERIAAALTGAGLEPGDRLAVLSRNSIEFVLIYYAAARAGVVPVPLNYRLAPAEWAWVVNDARARVLIASAEYLEAVQAVRDTLGKVERLVSLGPAAEGWTPWERWLAAAPATDVDRVTGDDHVLYQMYTSGTTGRPKGALLTHRAVTSNLAQFALAFEPRFGERWLVVVPMYHASGAVTSFAAIHAGGCLVIHRDFSPSEVVRALAEDGIGRTSLVPAMIQACLVAVPDAADRTYPALRFVAYGASPIAEGTLRRAMATFKCDFLQAYGMTEASAVLTYLLPADHARALVDRPGLLLSAGRPVAGTEIRVVDEHDRPLPPGAIGEIVARGPQLMQGYWNRPDETAEALRGGWLRTGDAGVLDDEGYVYVQDRVRDMIISGGENVYPRVVEDVLFAHPAVADVAVIGVPDTTWGETVKAVVVLRPGARATETDIIEFCRGRLGGFERPRSVDFVDTLPRNPSGKVLKRTLREKYWSGQTRRVAGA